jgi:hypothetical protein
MSHGRTLLLAIASLGVAALTASAANAQYRPYGAYGGPYASYGWPGRYCAYCADRSNPGVSPNGWDQDNPRDHQLQGTR